MSNLQSRRIVLGVTGGIAAYKAAELTRGLVKQGAHVQVVMTSAATEFVSPLTFQALSGQSVVLEDSQLGGNGMAHIQLGRHCDAMLIAPATADFIARLAHGLADDVLTSACLARQCSLWVAPAMNEKMWCHPATQRNVQQLRLDGVHVLGPDAGEQACGDNGPGRMLSPEALMAALTAHFVPQSLTGRRIVVTAGPTIERIDPVRALTNLSSGKMGYAVAQAAAEAGALVTLISGPVCLTAPNVSTIVQVESAADMWASVHAHVAQADVFISVAAVADYRPMQQHSHKLKKTAIPITLELVPNVDILASVAALEHPPFCVGFAAETERLLEHGEAKRRAKRVALMAVNRVQDALGSDENLLTLLDNSGIHELPRADKLTLARRLIEHIAPMLPTKLID